MVQRKAQVDEVRWSRLQTELASSQNLSVMIFTTFTVIFLPLSFFTSLFGMNTSEWAPEENYVSLKTIGAISCKCYLFPFRDHRILRQTQTVFAVLSCIALRKALEADSCLLAVPASLLLILLSLVLAFSTRLQVWFRTVFHLITSSIKVALSILAKLEPQKSKSDRDKTKVEAARLRRAQRQQRERENGYDYWQTVYEGRRRGYEIPGTNLKTISERRLQHRGDTWSSFRS